MLPCFFTLCNFVKIFAFLLAVVFAPFESALRRVIDEQWLAIARSRLREMRTGDVKPIPDEDVFTRIWKKRASANDD